MSELREALQERMRAVAFPPLGVDGIYARRDRRRRNARLRAGAVAVVVSIAAVIVVARAFPDPAPPVDEPSTAPPTAFLIDVGSGGTRPLPDALGTTAARQFAVAPTGDRIAYIVHGRVTISHLDGSDPVPVSPEGLPAWTPMWSPDGDRIVFGANASTTELDPRVFVVDVATGRLTPLTRGVATPYPVPSFSGDGSTVLFTGFDRARSSLALWTVPADGSREPTVLIDHAAFGTYAPDGATIAYHRAAAGDRSGAFVDRTVSVATANGQDRRRLEPIANGGSGPLIGWVPRGSTRVVWSPDGTMVAYEDTKLPLSGDIVHELRKILVVDIGTGGGRVIGEGRWPSWLDDDTLIVQTDG
jgi:Tol biopolymer transport system component